MPNLEEKEKHENLLILFNLLTLFSQLYVAIFINRGISIYLITKLYKPCFLNLIFTQFHII